MPGILIVAEHLRGTLRDISREMVGAANSIKDAFGGPVTVALLSSEPDALVQELKLEGVDQIAVVRTPADHFDPQIYEDAAIALGQQFQPGLILCSHTVNGMSFAAAVAARLGAGFASDVMALGVDGGALIATRGAYGNKVNLEVAFPNRGIVVLALRGATFPAPAPGGEPKIVPVELDLTAASASMSHLAYADAPPSDIDISKAEYILSVGRGIQDKDNLPRFQALADKMGFTFGASRPIIDAGWLPKAHQVGQSGKVASGCKVYIALGISGAVQHLFGMKHVDTIIAINTDPDAPIFNVATYGVNMDLFELAHELEAQFNG
jgi:electron transfer flavoprotein alpha subunit